MDFKHLTKEAEVPAESSREYVFSDLLGEPSLLVGPADDANAAYRAARLRFVVEETEKAVTRRRSEKPTVEELDRIGREGRETDMRLIAEGCVRGWGKSPPVDIEGKPVKFTTDNALDFLKALPDYIYGPFSNFTSNVRNFTVRALDAAKLGNS